MMWAACCLGYCAFLHCGEFTAFHPQKHLEVGDVAVDDYQEPTMLSIFLKQSKTDQDRAGVKLIVGRAHQDICPVAAVLAYVAVRAKRTTTALFVQKDGTHYQELYLYKNG